MNLRRFPLPLLLLAVTLAPAGTASGLNTAAHSGAPPLAAPSQPTAASAAINNASRRRRHAANGEEHRVSRDALDQVSNYLCRRSEDAPPVPELLATWDSFYQWCDGAIRRYAAGCRLRGPDLDDCTQEVWCDLVESLPAFRLDPSRGSFQSWLYRIVKSKAIDFRRRQARSAAKALPARLSERLREPALGPVEDQEHHEDLEALHRALLELQRQASCTSFQVLNLRQLEGWSVGEVAEVLGLTAEQVWAREHRMKRKLAKLLHAYGRAGGLSEGGDPRRAGLVEAVDADGGSWGWGHHAASGLDSTPVSTAERNNRGV